MYIICCICITLYISYLQYYQDGGGTQYMLPYNSPFSMGSDFFQKKTERVSVIVNKIHASIMHKCLVGEVTYIVPQTPAINLPLLNSHTVD